LWVFLMGCVAMICLLECHEEGQAINHSEDTWST